ncbi:hypothetical protein QAD02_024091 [Eretmocerus hayati]|uniref:Uncharacterized protein n=1 Tax=Eretmocerus hayati TaxID=131215 RepID=A0ACC2PXN8_9HYME|nr:hypothetical protein QAD02_024091 [Eretmocerus hayati]
MAQTAEQQEPEVDCKEDLQVSAEEELRDPVQRQSFGDRLLSLGSSSMCPLVKLGLELIGLSVRLSWTLLVASTRLLMPISDKSLLGEIVLITEAGRGIGRELALKFAALGSVVVCWDADAQANRDTLRVISTDGGEAYGFAVNLSDRTDIEKAVQSMRKAGISDVSILINNASTHIHRPFLEYTEKELSQIFEIEVLSQFRTIQTFLPSMLSKKRGHIVCLCNMCGFDAATHHVPYYATKCAKKGLMEGLSEELRLKADDASITLTTIHAFYTESADDRSNAGRRFSSIFGATSMECATKGVMRAIQKNYDECSIPRSLMYMCTVNRVVPAGTSRLIMDFLYGTKSKDDIPP